LTSLRVPNDAAEDSDAVIRTAITVRHEKMGMCRAITVVLEGRIPTPFGKALSIIDINFFEAAGSKVAHRRLNPLLIFATVSTGQEVPRAAPDDDVTRLC
jgi:hypothetical protein